MQDDCVKVVGIDPGLAATGVGVITACSRGIVDFGYGVIRTAAGTILGSRLEKIHRGVADVLAAEKARLVVIEDVFSLEKYPQSGITLGRVSGVILLAASQAGVPTLEVPVREVKQVLTGNGRADKRQLERAVRSALGAGQAIGPDHASDALGLALLGLYRMCGPLGPVPAGGR